MTRKSNLLGAFRVLPGVDFGLLLIVLTCGTAGLEWMEAKSQGSSMETTLPPTSPAELAAQIDALQEETESLCRKLNEKEKEANRIQAEHDKAEATRLNLNTSQVKRRQTQRDIEKLQRDIEALRKQLQELQQKEHSLQQQKKHSGQLQRAIAESGKRLDDLRRRLTELETANKNDENELAELEQLPLERPEIVVDFYTVFTARDSSNAVCVKLSKDTVAPLREPYYTFTRASNGIRVTRACAGETVNRALGPGSDFQNLLDEIAKTKQYVFLLVDSSSFATFRTVRDTLRQRKIPFGWEPTDATDFTFVASGGTDPGTVD